MRSFDRSFDTALFDIVFVLDVFDAGVWLRSEWRRRVNRSCIAKEADEEGKREEKLFFVINASVFNI